MIPPGQEQPGRPPEPGPDQARSDIAAALEELARLVGRAVPGCDGASVSLLHEGRPTTLAASQDTVRDLDEVQYARQRGPCVTAMHECTPITIDDFAAETRWPDIVDDLRQAGVRSSLSLPLPAEGQALGGLNLYAFEPGAFSATSRRTAEAFARQAAVMLGYLQQLHAERAAREQERALSAVLQRSLLPVLPELPGLTCAARYLVGSRTAQVGGDWYDLFALPDGAIGVAVGDVMGHDLTAAAAMGQLRSVLRSYAYEGSSPSVVLDRLDRLVQDFEMAQLATAVYGRLVLDEPPQEGAAPGDGTGRGGTLLFTNAGHLPPLLRLPGGPVRQLRRGASPLIGAVPPGLARRGEGAVAMPAGSLLVLYTDGLVESRDRDLDQGITTLADALAGLPEPCTPDEACERLLTAVPRAGQDDDIALLVLRLDP